MLMCPHCGWTYNPNDHTTPGDDGRSFALVPKHADRVLDLIDVFASCQGSDQHPRNPESDRRPLWKDGGSTVTTEAPTRGPRE